MPTCRTTALRTWFTSLGMYYSRVRRQAAFKLLVVGIIVFGLSVTFYVSPWLRRSACTLSLISWSPVCPKISSNPWKLFHHLGGNGPWISRQSTQNDSLNPLPLNCAVDQVHMISRHAERYPTLKAGRRHLHLLAKLQSPDVELQGQLKFLKEWSYFTNTSRPSFENLTNSGPYSGTLQPFRTGQKLRQRYDNLVNTSQNTNFWTCSSPRDIETAQHFARGFFGESWETSDTNGATLHIIPEEESRGANTLTPGDTCLDYIKDLVEGHDKGYAELNKWQDRFTAPISARLSPLASGLVFSPLEIYSMMEMCGFEILARGSSPWCDIFSHDEWLDFEYARDLLHFYRAGPGNKFAGAMGWLWLNATTALLSHGSNSDGNNDDVSRGVYFSFVHDGDIIPVLATLGILDEDQNSSAAVQYLPNNRRKENRRWKTSDVVPMGGRMILERVTCKNTGIAQNLRRQYVRMWINDGIVDLETDLIGIGGSGLQMSAGMESWKQMIKNKGEKFGSFGDVCGLKKDVPWTLDFLTPQGE